MRTKHRTWAKYLDDFTKIRDDLYRDLTSGNVPKEAEGEVLDIIQSVDKIRDKLLCLNHQRRSP